MDGAWPGVVGCHILLPVYPAGPNLSFYTPSFSSSSSSRQHQLAVTGLEPNTAMWRYAQQAAAAAGLQQQLQLVEGDAQQMPFNSSSFDAAVMTLVSPGSSQSCVTSILIP
jgi:hypothetical protein